MDESDLQEIAQRACKFLDIPFVKIIVKGGACRGYAKPKMGRATVPAWALKIHDGYAVYYTLHKLVHFKVWKHGTVFRAVEQKLCGQFQILLEYRRVYPNAVIYNGEKISCTRKDIIKKLTES
jgi:hypothetical protein